jgi:YgiT-type zinc finger domain-containing protein
MDDAKPLPVPCPRCGEAMRPAIVKTAIWREERIFLVEQIPAQVCDSCIEQFYDEETTDALRRLTEEGFASLTPNREVLVPVFSLEGQIRRSPSAASSEEEIYADY